MRKWNKLLALLLAMVMALGLTVTGFAEDEEDGAETEVEAFVVPEDAEGAIVILHTNDVHGAVENYAKVAALKAMYEEAGAEVFVMDAGDFIQGETYVSVSEGDTAIELMNMVGYDAVAPGNHEFDFGYENLTVLAEKAEFPILAANITYEGEVAFGDHIVLEKGGVKLGVFGLDTPETASKAHPAKIKGVSFAGGEDMYAVAQAEVDALAAEGCDYIICLGHLGIDDETAATANRSVDLLENVTGIDVFIDGHSHSTLDEVQAHDMTDGDGKVGDTLVTSTGTKLVNVGVITIKDGEIRAASVPSETIEVAEDDAIAARAKEIVDEIEAEYGAPFATTAVLLNGDREPGNRTEETNLGDLITDAMIWYATKDGEDLGVPPENIVALTNGGGIRVPVEMGEITKNNINAVLPFGNTVAYVTVTGAALLEVLEASTYCTPAAIGGFPQASGVHFTIDATKEYDQGEIYGDTTYYAPASINRVTINEINGQDFDPEAEYIVVTNDFCAAGGDTYFALTESESIVDTGTPLDEALIQYITEVLDGAISADYAEPVGRITVILPPYADVAEDAWYADAVEYVTANGLIDGVNYTTFAPTEEATRATLVEALYRLAGSPEVTGEVPFEDVAADASYASAVIWAKENNVVNGVTETTFEPDGVVLRRDVAAMLARLVGEDTADASDEALSIFADADTIPDYAKASIAWAVTNQLLNGDNGNMLPANTAERCEIADILQRFAPLYEASLTA